MARLVDEDGVASTPEIFPAPVHLGGNGNVGSFRSQPHGHRTLWNGLDKMGILVFRPCEEVVFVKVLGLGDERRMVKFRNLIVVVCHAMKH